MSNKKKRGLLASAGALVTAVALALGGSVAAHAAPVAQMPDESGVIITKTSNVPGDEATGLPTGLTTNPIEGVTFEAYVVPLPGGPTPGTNVWQEAVADMTLADAQAAIGATPAAFRSGTTLADGTITWKTDAVGEQGDSLPRGLYLVRETAAPAGVVPSGDFFLAVPLTHPTELDHWLADIYVYPKNRVVEGEKTVENAEDFLVGDTVTWTIDLDNPSARANSGDGDYIAGTRFQILDTIEDAYLEVEDLDDVVVTAPADLTAGSGPIDDAAAYDYHVALVAGTGPAPAGNGIAEDHTQVQITFTAQGRAALAAAINADEDDDRVVITIDTKVLQVGVIENSAQFFSSDTQNVPTEVPGTDVRYGAISLIKTSNITDEAADLAGAEFRVYLSEAAALAASESNNWGGVYTPGTPDLDPAEADYVAPNPNGYVIPEDGPVDGVFVTAAGGNVTIGGLRYSNYADGETLQTTDLRYQTYWLLETKALDEHQLLGEPYSFLITAQQADLDPIEIENQADGGFELPLTGGTGTALLTILGVGILAFVLVMARRRHAAAE